MDLVEDDGFDSIVAGLDLDTETALPQGVRALSDLELVRRRSQVRQLLLRYKTPDGESWMTEENPSTQEARDLHSERVALEVEMKRRNLK